MYETAQQRRRHTRLTVAVALVFVAASVLWVVGRITSEPALKFTGLGLLTLSATANLVLIVQRRRLGIEGSIWYWMRKEQERRSGSR